MINVAKQTIRAIIEVEIMCNMNTPKTPNCFRQLGVLLGVRENGQDFFACKKGK
ncbi:hypothetical protein HB833_14760 [Listeria innocua]|nr:hypothetical protein [Listeria innocua]